jgi:hypothetical protein
MMDQYKFNKLLMMEKKLNTENTFVVHKKERIKLKLLETIEN